MPKFWLYTGIIVISLITIFSIFSIKGIGFCYQYGNLLVLAITAIILLIYTFYTYKIAEVTEEELLQQTRPSIGFQLESERTLTDRITHVWVANNSKFFCEVYIDLNAQVYNKPVIHSDKYAGKEPWYILPNSSIKGWFSISEMLKKDGKNLLQVIKDNKQTEDKKLTLDIHIKGFNLGMKDKKGAQIEYPKLHWYFDFNKNKWVYMS